MTTWNTDLRDAPDQCVVILSMGRDPKTGNHYDIVCEAKRDIATQMWSGNAMHNIEQSVRAWAPLPDWFNGQQVKP